MNVCCVQLRTGYISGVTQWIACSSSSSFMQLWMSLQFEVNWKCKRFFVDRSWPFNVIYSLTVQRDSVQFARRRENWLERMWKRRKFTIIYLKMCKYTITDSRYLRLSWGWWFFLGCDALGMLCIAWVSMSLESRNRVQDDRFKM